MTNPPPITREAREWLLGRHEGHTYYDLIRSMPLAPADPLDAVRARFQPKTRGGYEYEIFAERDGLLWGRVKILTWSYAMWKTDGTNNHQLQQDLLPASPHAALIAELRREATQRKADLGKSRMADLMQQAADALEGGK